MRGRISGRQIYDCGPEESKNYGGFNWDTEDTRAIWFFKSELTIQHKFEVPGTYFCRVVRTTLTEDHVWKQSWNHWSGDICHRKEYSRKTEGQGQTLEFYPPLICCQRDRNQQRNPRRIQRGIRNSSSMDRTKVECCTSIFFLIKRS